MWSISRRAICAAFAFIAATIATPADGYGYGCKEDACFKAVHRSPYGAADCKAAYPPLTVTIARQTTTSTYTPITTITITARTTTTKQSTRTSVKTVATTTTTIARVTDDALRKRAGAHSVPSYASDCKNRASYLSACSCNGVTHGTTITAAAPPQATRTVTARSKSTVTMTRTTTKTTTKVVSTTRTSTQTQTATSTTTVQFPSATCSSGPFILRYLTGPSTLQYHYALLSNTGSTDYATPGPIDAATTFTISTTGQLLGYNDEIANIDPGVTQETLYFSPEAELIAGGYVPATCRVDAGGDGVRTLACIDQTATMLYMCENNLSLQIGATVPTGCTAVRAEVLYVCGGR